MTRPRRRRKFPPLLAATSLAAFVVSAGAQVAGTVGLASQDRYRGLADDIAGPALRGSVMADSAEGAYAGVSSLWMTDARRFSRTQLLLGISRRLDADLAWDAGLLRTHFSGDGTYDYTEAMAGLVGGDWSVRLWGSPHYVGRPAATLYLEAEASHVLAEGWRALAHVGVLDYVNSPAGHSPQPPRTDAMVALEYSHGPFEARLSLDGIVAGHAPADSRTQKPGCVFSLTVAF